MSLESLGIAYAWLVVAFALLVTVLARKQCAARWGEYAGHITYFAAFFVLLGLAPAAVVVASNGPAALGLVGFGPGNIGRGVVMLGIGLIISFPLMYFAARDPELARQYPLARLAAWDRRRFTIYELVYAVGYYVAWEFTFRGLLFFPLLAVAGLLPALAVQTIISTLLHIGHPDSEIWSAVVGGILLGLGAWWTGSFIYAFVIHAGCGVAHDTIRFLQQRRAANLR